MCLNPSLCVKLFCGPLRKWRLSQTPTCKHVRCARSYAAALLRSPPIHLPPPRPPRPPTPHLPHPPGDCTSCPVCTPSAGSAWKATGAPVTLSSSDAPHATKKCLCRNQAWTRFPPRTFSSATCWMWWYLLRNRARTVGLHRWSITVVF